MKNAEVLYQEVGQKIDQLLAKHDALQYEHKALQSKVEELKQNINEKEHVISKLNEENKVLSMAKSLSGDNDSNKEMKLKINELVREIDKCISLLNS